MILSQCIAVHRSVLQCGAVYYSVLQCVAVRCSALQCIAVCYSLLRSCILHCVQQVILSQRIVVRYSVMQSLAVCCIMLQCAAVCCSVLQCASDSNADALGRRMRGEKWDYVFWKYISRTQTRLMCGFDNRFSVLIKCSWSRCFLLEYRLMCGFDSRFSILNQKFMTTMKFSSVRFVFLFDWSIHYYFLKWDVSILSIMGCSLLKKHHMYISWYIYMYVYIYITKSNEHPIIDNIETSHFRK